MQVLYEDHVALRDASVLTTVTGDWKAYMVIQNSKKQPYVQPIPPVILFDSDAATEEEESDEEDEGDYSDKTQAPTRKNPPLAHPKQSRNPGAQMTVTKKGESDEDEDDDSDNDKTKAPAQKISPQTRPETTTKRNRKPSLRMIDAQMQISKRAKISENKEKEVIEVVDEEEGDEDDAGADDANEEDIQKDKREDEEEDNESEEDQQTRQVNPVKLVQGGNYDFIMEPSCKHAGLVFDGKKITAILWLRYFKNQKDKQMWSPESKAGVISKQRCKYFFLPRSNYQALTPAKLKTTTAFMSLQKDVWLHVRYDNSDEEMRPVATFREAQTDEAHRVLLDLMVIKFLMWDLNANFKARHFRNDVFYFTWNSKKTFDVVDDAYSKCLRQERIWKRYGCSLEDNGNVNIAFNEQFLSHIRYVLANAPNNSKENQDAVGRKKRRGRKQKVSSILKKQMLNKTNSGEPVELLSSFPTPIIIPHASCISSDQTNVSELNTSRLQQLSFFPVTPTSPDPPCMPPVTSPIIEERADDDNADKDNADNDSKDNDNEEKNNVDEGNAYEGNAHECNAYEGNVDEGSTDAGSAEIKQHFEQQERQLQELSTVSSTVEKLQDKEELENNMLKNLTAKEEVVEKDEQDTQAIANDEETNSKLSIDDNREEVLDLEKNIRVNEEEVWEDRELDGGITQKENLVDVKETSISASTLKYNESLEIQPNNANLIQEKKEETFVQKAKETEIDQPERTSQTQEQSESEHTSSEKQLDNNNDDIVPLVEKDNIAAPTQLEETQLEKTYLQETPFEEEKLPDISLEKNADMEMLKQNEGNVAIFEVVQRLTKDDESAIYSALDNINVEKKLNETDLPIVDRMLSPLSLPLYDESTFCSKAQIVSQPLTKPLSISQPMDKVNFSEAAAVSLDAPSQLLDKSQESGSEGLALLPNLLPAVVAPSSSRNLQPLVVSDYLSQSQPFPETQPQSALPPPVRLSHLRPESSRSQKPAPPPLPLPPSISTLPPLQKKSQAEKKKQSENPSTPPTPPSRRYEKQEPEILTLVSRDNTALSNTSSLRT